MIFEEVTGRRLFFCAAGAEIFEMNAGKRPSLQPEKISLRRPSLTPKTRLIFSIPRFAIYFNPGIAFFSKKNDSQPISKMMDEIQKTMVTPASGISRRRFFGYAGALAGAGLLTGMAACQRSDDGRINMGSGDLGLLNYAYALEQMQASFYSEILHLPFTGITPAELSYIQDIRDHEVAHRDFLKAFLGSNAVQELTGKFTSVNFYDRSSVLTTARMLKDLIVSAYNGMGKLFTNTAEGASYLSVIAKIVSVEARHAAIIRELIQANSFADTSIVDPVTRIDRALDPASVIAQAGPYFYEGLNVDNFPTA